MYVTWQMIVGGFIAVCVGFSSICVAGGWLVKIIKGLKKPSEDVNTKLKNDKERLDNHDELLKDLVQTQPMILRSLYVILQHMRTNNSTGEIAKQEQAISDYLFNR